MSESSFAQHAQGILAATIAAGVQTSPIAESQVTGAVSRASLIPGAAVTHNASTYRTYTLVNKGQDGTGSTAIGAINTSAVDLAANDRVDFPITAANAAVAVGDVLSIVETVASTGVVGPASLVEVHIQRTGV